MGEADDRGIYSRVEPTSGVRSLEHWRSDKKRHRKSPPERKPLLNRKILIRTMGLLMGVVCVAGGIKVVKEVLKRSRAARAELSEQARSIGSSSLLQVKSDAEESGAWIQPLIENSKRADFLLEEVEPLIDRRLFAEAERKIRVQMEATPNLIDLKLKLAMVCMYQKRWPEAQGLLMDVLSVTPRNIAARCLLARILIEVGKSEEAYPIAVWILEQVPLDVEGLLLASKASLLSKEYERAVTHLHVLLRVSPDNQIAKQLMAVAYLRLGQYARAVTKLTELIQSVPSDPVNHYNLAVCYAQQGLVEDTVNALQRSLGHLDSGVVRSWLQEEDFRAIQKDALFQAFVSELVEGSATVLLNSRIKQEDGVGLLPAVPVELRHLEAIPGQRSGSLGR